MIPAASWSTLPCLVSSGTRNISLGGVKAALRWLSGGNEVEEEGNVREGSVKVGSVKVGSVKVDCGSAMVCD